MVHESKRTASISFFSEKLQKIVSGPHPATLHFFEHDYDVQRKFWYGIADVACTLDVIDRDAQNAGLSLPAGSQHNIQSFDLVVYLDDGRFGSAKCLSWSDYFGPTTTNYLEITFTGVTKLQQQP